MLCKRVAVCTSSGHLEKGPINSTWVAFFFCVPLQLGSANPWSFFFWTRYDLGQTLLKALCSVKHDTHHRIRHLHALMGVVVLMFSSLFSALCPSSLPSSFSFSWSSPLSSMMWGTSTLRILANEDICTFLEYDLHTSMEETSKRGVLGRHQSCSKERIFALSNKIERNHLSRTTSSLLHLASYNDGNWRKFIRHLQFLQRFLLKTKRWKNCKNTLHTVLFSQFRALIHSD